MSFLPVLETLADLTLEDDSPTTPPVATITLYADLPSDVSPPFPPQLRRSKRIIHMEECQVCHYHCDDIDSTGACTACILDADSHAINVMKRPKFARSISEPIITNYDNTMKELELASKILPLYVNSVLSPTDFRPSRIKRYRTYYRHLVPAPRLVNVELNPGPCDYCSMPIDDNLSPSVWCDPGSGHQYFDFCTIKCMLKWIHLNFHCPDNSVPTPPLVGVELNPGPSFIKSSVYVEAVIGDDVAVVNAARVSFNKQITEMGESDTKLITYLANHGHWSPFSHPQIRLRIKIPIFVARQWFKHTVGFTRNEVSRRYVNSDPEFYYCAQWRKAAKDVKQGSSNEIFLNDEFQKSYENTCNLALGTYNHMIQSGVCSEQARMLLPQSAMTEFIETGSLYGYARLCQLRLDTHAQKEIREVAEEVYKIMNTYFPISWKALQCVPPGPPLVGIETNPGPTLQNYYKVYIVYRRSNTSVLLEHRVDTILQMVNGAVPLIKLLEVTQEYIDFTYNKSYYLYDFSCVPLVGVELNPGPSSEPRPLCKWCQQSVPDILGCPFICGRSGESTLIHHTFCSWICVTQFVTADWYMSNNIPAPPLVGVEPNPGPTVTLCDFCDVKISPTKVSRPSINMDSLKQYLYFCSDKCLVNWVIDNKTPVPSLPFIRFMDGTCATFINDNEMIRRVREHDVIKFVPPAPPLVDIETNPGPDHRKDIIITRLRSKLNGVPKAPPKPLKYRHMNADFNKCMDELVWMWEGWSAYLRGKYTRVNLKN